MRLELDGRDVFVGTGGVERGSGGGSHGDTSGDDAAPAARPCVVFVHGAGMDRTAWLLHARWFARRGFDVIAPDLPGHGGSAGPPLADVQAMADWLGTLLETLGVGRGANGDERGEGDGAPLALVGHSMGALVALEAASRTVHAASLLLLGVGYPDGRRRRAARRRGAQRARRDRHDHDPRTRPRVAAGPQPDAGHQRRERLGGAAGARGARGSCTRTSPRAAPTTGRRRPPSGSRAPAPACASSPATRTG